MPLLGNRGLGIPSEIRDVDREAVYEGGSRPTPQAVLHEFRQGLGSVRQQHQMDVIGRQTVAPKCRPNGVVRNVSATRGGPRDRSVEEDVPTLHCPAG